MATNVSDLMSKSNAAAAQALGLHYAGLPSVPNLSFLAPTTAALKVADEAVKPPVKAITQLGVDAALRNATQALKDATTQAELFKKSREQPSAKADAAGIQA